MNNELDFERLESNKGALINKNMEALAAYKKQKTRYKKLNKIEELEDKVDRLTSLVEELIKKL